MLKGSERFCRMATISLKEVNGTMVRMGDSLRARSRLRRTKRAGSPSAGTNSTPPGIVPV